MRCEQMNRQTQFPSPISPHAILSRCPVWSEVLATKYGLALTSFAVGNATINAMPNTPSGFVELAIYDRLNATVRQPAAAVIQLGAYGEDKPASEGTGWV